MGSAAPLTAAGSWSHRYHPAPRPVKIDPRRVGQMMVACDVGDRRYVVTTFGWIALRARGTTAQLTLSARPATVYSVQILGRRPMPERA